MNQAIRIHENGGPEVLRLEDTKVDPPGFGEVLIRHTACLLYTSDAADE